MYLTNISQSLRDKLVSTAGAKNIRIKIRDRRFFRARSDRTVTHVENRKIYIYIYIIKTLKRFFINSSLLTINGNRIGNFCYSNMCEHDHMSAVLHL